MQFPLHARGESLIIVLSKQTNQMEIIMNNIIALNQLITMFPQFINEMKDSGFKFVGAETESNYVSITIMDEYGLKYVGDIANDQYFDIDMFEYIG